jgi:quinol monooxygenase YgiN
LYDPSHRPIGQRELRPRSDPKGAQMIELRDFDPEQPFLTQLASTKDSDPIVLVNTFIVPPGLADELVEVWRLDSEIMRRQPGFISAQLHRGVGASAVLTNVAVWESAAALLAAFNNDEFQRTLAQYPDGAVAYPVVVRPRAVPGICVA